METKTDKEIETAVREDYKSGMSVSDICGKYYISQNKAYLYTRDMRIHTVECPVCHKVFESNVYNKKFCSAECANICYAEQKKQRDRERAQKLKQKLEQGKDVVSIPKTGKTLAEMNEEARRHHMTYGQYMMFLQEQQEQKHGSRRGEKT